MPRPAMRRDFIEKEEAKMANHSRINEKIRNAFEDTPDLSLLRSCTLCVHYRVCVMRKLFGEGVAPQFPEGSVKVDDLAKICGEYKEERKEFGV
jgi:hypothetical protein